MKKNHIGDPSSETQGQIKEARESLKGRTNIYGTKKSKERREESLNQTRTDTKHMSKPANRIRVRVSVYLFHFTNEQFFFCRVVLIRVV